MKVFTKSLYSVTASGRDDFDFHDPSVDSIQQIFSSQSGFITLERLSLKVKTGKTPARVAYATEGVRILKVKNITGSGVNWNNEAFVTLDFYNRAVKAHVQEDDILMLCSAHSKSYIGRCDIVKNLIEHIPDNLCCAVGELIIIRANKDLILPEYLLTYLRLGVVQDEISKMVKGQSAHLYPQDLAKLEIVVPSPTKQEEIASIAVQAETTYRQQITAVNVALNHSRRHVQELIYGLSDAFTEHAQHISLMQILPEQGLLPLEEDEVLLAPFDVDE